MATNGNAHRRSALVLYGTETGTSQDLAEEVGRTLERLYFETNVGELDNFSATDLSRYTLTVLVLSTTGQGEFPSNAKKFWTGLLRKKLTSTFLADVEYALVGLGDTSYPKFNWAARKLGKRLKQLGAQELVDACEADEQGDEGTDGAYLAWSQQFRDALARRYPLSDGRLPIPDDVLLPSKWRLLSLGNRTPEDVVRPHVVSAPGFYDIRPTTDSFSVTVKANVRVTPASHWQDVRHIRLESEGHRHYLPGDAISIMPDNNDSDVFALLKQMDWTTIADLPLQFASRNTDQNDSAPPVPYLLGQTLTIRTLLRKYLDITAIPRRSFLAAIANFTDDSMHKHRLIEFTKPEYLDEYFDYATRPRRSILEILQEFDSVKIPWQEAANIFPVMRPRQFSIASGGSQVNADNSTSFEILAAIVKYRTVIKRTREGVCTRYLAGLQLGSTLNVVLKTEGRFHARTDDVPSNHLLIGAGTGVAPLRALILEKQSMPKATPKQMSTMLVFGGRSVTADFFFEKEWEFYQEIHHMHDFEPFKVVTAFSRDQKNKVYVQDRIRDHADEIFDLICKQHATVIVCGSSGAMPKAVREALLDVMIGRPLTHSEGAWTRDDAERYLAEMEKRGRYKQDTW